MLHLERLGDPNTTVQFEVIPALQVGLFSCTGELFHQLLLRATPISGSTDNVRGYSSLIRLSAVVLCGELVLSVA